MSLNGLKSGSEFTGNRERKDSHVEVGLQAPRVNDRPSIASINESVSSLTLTVNSAMAALSLLIDSGEGFAQRLSGPDNKEQFREYFLKMRREFQAVSVITESLGVLSKLAIDQSAAANVDQIERTLSTPCSNFPSAKISPAQNPVER